VELFAQKVLRSVKSSWRVIRALVEEQPDVSMVGIIPVRYHIVQAAGGHAQAEIQ